MRQLLMCVMVVFIISCSGKKEVKQEEEIKVYALKMDSLTYNVKIQLSKATVANMDRKTIENMMYRADSCIYLKVNDKRVYPIYTENIANGSKSTFEYMVEFEKGVEKNKNLIYQDRYINNKTYPLNLK